MKRESTFRTDFGIEIHHRPSRLRSRFGYAIGVLLSLAAWTFFAWALMQRFGIV